MTRTLSLMAIALLSVTACNKQDSAGDAPTAAKTSGSTIAGSIDSNSRFGKALAAAGMTKTFDGPAAYTVLAPNDAAFDKLPAGAEDTLLKPEGRAELTKLLSTHVLAGTILTADLDKAITAGGGKTTLPTLSGEVLTATKEGDAIVLKDSAGGSARIVGTGKTFDNGVLTEIDAVLMPKG